VAINLDWRVTTGPIWHILIGASLQFASRDLSLHRSLIPVGTFCFVSAAARCALYAPIMIIVVLVPLLYILVLARLEN